MGLLLLLYPILEILTIVRVGGEIGVMNTLFAFVAAGVLGLGIVKTRGKFMLGNFQASLARGEIPAGQALHSIMIIIGGFGLMAPGFLSDAVGLLLILPGSRHLIARYMKSTLERKMRSGSFRIFTAGNVPPFGANPRPPQQPGEWRDVSPREIRGDVIEAEVVERTTRDPSSSDDSN
ncbi:MAG: FxsA family protein [Bdellovibrionota bacterium]